MTAPHRPAGDSPAAAPSADGPAPTPPPSGAPARTTPGVQPDGPAPARTTPGAPPSAGGAPTAPAAGGAAAASGRGAPPGPAAGTQRTPAPAAAATGGAVLPAARAGAAPEEDARSRVEGMLLGLAAGDAAGWPAARHRAVRMPEWTRRLTRELDTFAEQNETTTLPVPIALNQPPEPLRLGPSDDAEWAAFTAEAVVASRGALLSDLSRDRRVRASVDLAWMSLAAEISSAAARAPEVESAQIPLRARISVRAGLGNLATGLRPPASGHDNPHFFDDAACVRACVLAVVHPGDPEAAAGLAEFDARYTQDEDGVHGARAMAAAVALALAGAGAAECVAAAQAQLPAGSEIARNAEHAVDLARAAAREAAGGRAFGLVPLLEHQIIDHVYSYGIAAADTVPVALALVLAADGAAVEAVPAAACLSRVADSAPALAGALAGAMGGAGSLPGSWRAACRILAGCALPRLAGLDLMELAGRLAAIEPAVPAATPSPEGLASYATDA
ncbi:ADP-ribosylglycohydrolase family protein [Streptomyces sp. NPDC020983]|uniref:ADP-ribosylglycohydrolase family protein n=1 Tax=Streptomyces sp. NPDC020983 TaxID=3365106 RepID=UPI003792FD23